MGKTMKLAAAAAKSLAAASAAVEAAATTKGANIILGVIKRAGKEKRDY